MRSVCKLITGRPPGTDEDEIAVSTTFKLNERRKKTCSRGRGRGNGNGRRYGASIWLWDFGCPCRFLESGKEREGLLISMMDFLFNRLSNISLDSLFSYTKYLIFNI